LDGTITNSLVKASENAERNSSYLARLENV